MDGFVIYFIVSIHALVVRTYRFMAHGLMGGGYEFTHTRGLTDLSILTRL